MDMGFACRKNAIFPRAHKIGAAISGPRIADKFFMDTRIFLIQVTITIAFIFPLPVYLRNNFVDHGSVHLLGVIIQGPSGGQNKPLSHLGVDLEAESKKLR